LTLLVIGARKESIQTSEGKGGGPEKSRLFYWWQFRKDRISTYYSSMGMNFEGWRLPTETKS
jgi:hypothetical protein